MKMNGFVLQLTAIDFVPFQGDNAAFTQSVAGVHPALQSLLRPRRFDHRRHHFTSIL